MICSKGSKPFDYSLHGSILASTARHLAVLHFHFERLRGVNRLERLLKGSARRKDGINLYNALNSLQERPVAIDAGSNTALPRENVAEARKFIRLRIKLA